MLGGISRQRVHELAARPDFPQPVARLSAGMIWRRADVEDWMRRTGRQPVEEDGLPEDEDDS